MDISSSTYVLQVWSCHLEDLKLLTDYIINVTAVNSLGSRSNFTSFMLEDIGEIQSSITYSL